MEIFSYSQCLLHWLLAFGVSCLALGLACFCYLQTCWLFKEKMVTGIFFFLPRLRQGSPSLRRRASAAAAASLSTTVPAPSSSSYLPFAAHARHTSGALSTALKALALVFHLLEFPCFNYLAPLPDSYFNIQSQLSRIVAPGYWLLGARHLICRFVIKFISSTLVCS